MDTLDFSTEEEIRRIQAEVKDINTVHNHGTEEGLGVACPERLVGQCVLDAERQAMQAAQKVLENVTKERNNFWKFYTDEKARADRLQAEVEHWVKMNQDLAQQLADQRAEIERLKNQHKIWAEYIDGEGGWRQVLQSQRAAMDGLVGALKALADNVEENARDSFATCEGPFDEDFEREDPEGFKVWKQATSALAEVEKVRGKI